MNLKQNTQHANQVHQEHLLHQTLIALSSENKKSAPSIDAFLSHIDSAFLESGCTQVQSWSGPGEGNRGSPVGPISTVHDIVQYMYNSTPQHVVPEGRVGRRVLNIRATNPTPESHRRILINAGHCSL